MTPAPGFAKYRSHKVVEAAPIKAAEMEADGSGKVALGDGSVVLVPEGFQRSYGDLASAVEGAGAMLVRYPDGYLSWSPMAPFLEGYTAEPEDYRARVVVERDELAARLLKLRQFIARDPRADDLMHGQAYRMGQYLAILDQRIAAFPA